jgi:O-antigen ligase
MSEMAVRAGGPVIGVGYRIPARTERTGLELSLGEIAAAVILLLYGNAVYIPVLMPNTGGFVTANSQQNEIHGVNHIVLAVVWITVALLIARSWDRMRFRSLPALFCLSFSFWGLASTLWSSSPSAAFSAGLGAVFSTFFAIYVFSRFSRRRIIVILMWVFMVLAVGNVILALFLPAYGIDHFNHEGAWQGVFPQKNELGNAMVCGLAVGIAFRAQSFLERAWRATLLVVSTAEVFLSQSREAWVAALLVIILYLFIKLLSRVALYDSRSLMVLCSGSTFVLGALAIAYGPILLRVLDRDATLTGRTDIWRATVEQFSGHWMLGYGLNSFWGSPEANGVYVLLRWTPSSSHNGYLETLLQVGIVGLGLMLLTLLLAWKDAWLSIRNRELDLSILAYIMICVLPLLNTVVFLIPYPNSITWLLLILSALMLEEDAKRHHRIEHSACAVLGT